MGRPHYEVQAALGNVDSAVVDAGRAGSGYVITGSTDFLNNFEAAVPTIYRDLQNVRELTIDNPDSRNFAHVWKN